MKNQVTNAFVEDEIPCLDKSIRYQKRPKRHTTIRVEIGILAIHEFSSSKMDMKAELYLYQTWTDIRCKFTSQTGRNNLTIYTRPNGETHRGLQNLWQPDTHVLNAKATGEMRPEIVTHIWKRGKVCFAIVQNSTSVLRYMDVIYPCLCSQHEKYDHSHHPFIGNQPHQTFNYC